MSNAQGGSPDLNRMRGERDRFVAFAFCNADLLIEVNAKGKVVFTGGATRALIGAPGDALVGKDFMALVAEGDRKIVRHALERAKNGEPFAEVSMHFHNGKKMGPRAVMSGYVLPRLNNQLLSDVSPGRR